MGGYLYQLHQGDRSAGGPPAQPQGSGPFLSEKGGGSGFAYVPGTGEAASTHLGLADVLGRGSHTQGPQCV